MMQVESSEKEFQQLVEKRKKEIQLEVDKKIHNYKTIYVAIELALGLIGFGIIVYTGGWLLALGVGIAMWGNNLMQNRKFW
jgi:hypothetical protein